MTKVLFFNVPAYGHTNPSLPMVAELVRRGEQVVYYSSEVFQPAIEQTGAEFRSIGQFMNDQTYIDENLIRVALLLIQTTWDILTAMLPAITAEQPDYIIFDSLCVWGKCIAQILQVPSISSTTALAFPNLSIYQGGIALLFSVLPMMPRMFFEARADLPKFNAIAGQISKTYSIPKIPLDKAINNLAELNIVYSIKQLQLSPSSFDDTFKFVGPSIGIRPETSPFPLEELGDDPLIYISLGTVFNNKEDFYRLCIRTFMDLKYRVVMSVGAKTDISSLGVIPNNILVKPFVPQLELLQHATLFVTHAGMNSVTEGLLAGVPMLMVPQAVDQSFIARRVQQLGAGKMLSPSRLNEIHLRKAAEEVLTNPAFREASANVGALLRQTGGPKSAVDEIEAFKQRHGL